MILGSGLLQSNWPRASDWLVRDEFTDTRSAGSVNGTAATPGPGTRTVTDAGNKLSVGSGSLNSSGGAVAHTVYESVAPSTGLGIFARIISSDAYLGYDSTYVYPLVAYSMNISVVYGYPDYIPVGSKSAAEEVECAVVLDTDGGKLFRKISGSWRMDYRIKQSLPGGNNDALVLVGATAAETKFDYFRVLQLPGPFDSDDGIATDVLSGSVSAGTTFTHEADCLIEFTVDTLPSTSISIDFRRVDDGNRWSAYINSSGNLALNEYTNGVLTQRAVTAGPVSNGHRVVIIADGTTIRGYYNNTLAWTYSGATQLATATAGKVFSLGNGAISNVKTWPRTLDGIAASVLNKASA